MADLGHNSGLSPQEASESMERALAPYDARREEFATKAGQAKVDDLESAQVAVDFVRMARALKSKAEELRAEVEQPYKEASEAIRGTAMQFIDSVAESIETVENKIKAYNAERKAQADARAREQRKAEEELRRQAAARDGGGEGETPPPVAEPSSPSPTPTPGPTIRTALGGRMTETKKWRPKVTDVSKVPQNILETPKVIAAIEQVSRAFLQNGMKVPGVEKEEYDSHTIS